MLFRSSSFRFPWTLLCLSCIVLPATGQRGDNPDAKPLTPQEQLATFRVPPGFQVQLVAAEAEISKPLNLNFDAAGRLWVTSTEIYPWAARTDALGNPISGFDKAWEEMFSHFKLPKGDDTIAKPPEIGRDTIRVLSDISPDGRARKVKVFADGLNIPIGVQPLPRPPGSKGDTVIAHSIPNIWKFSDTDGDGVADQREPLYTGFGYKDTHGMSSNYEYAFDGWIYGCHGFANHSEVRDGAGNLTVLDSGNTYRFRSDGSKFEFYSRGQTNPFGLTSDTHGDFYTCDSHSRPSMLVLPGGFYEGIFAQPDGLGYAPRIMEHDHGSSAIAGIAWYGASQFPEEFRNNTFNGNPVTRRINRDRYEWTGSTPKAVALPDFLTCEDPWFRPVQVKLGPDGALYIADFYTPIIGHYEVPLTDPRRDQNRGRIWRIVWRGENAKALVMPDLSTRDTAGLIAGLADDNLVVRQMAVNEIVDRVGKDAIGPLQKLISDKAQPAVARALGAFAVQRLGEKTAADTSSSDSVAAALALRLLGERPLWEDAERTQARTALASSDARTRRAAALSIARHPEGMIASLLQARSNNEEDRQMQYALMLALRDALKREGGHAEAMLALGKSSGAESAALDIADASLAVPTAESARALLNYLMSAQLSVPRAGEYLGFIMKHLPSAEIRELTKLLSHAKSLPEEAQIKLSGALAPALNQEPMPLPQALAEWVNITLTEGLLSSNDDLAIAAIVAVRDMRNETNRELLTGISRDKQRAADVRINALVALSNLPNPTNELRLALNDTSAMPLRIKAASLLSSRRNDSEAQNHLLEALPDAPGELATEIALRLTEVDPGAAALCDLIEQGKVSATLLRQRTVASNLGKRSQALKDRATALTEDLPAEDTRLDAVILDRVRSYAAAKPDSKRGGQVFATLCTACHQFKGNGGLVGPNLDGIRSRGPQRLVEDILDPNRNVDPLFHLNTFETTDGQTITGTNLREEGSNLVFNNAAGQPQTIAKSLVKSKTRSLISLMPAGFENVIPEKDLHDLLSYLLAE